MKNDNLQVEKTKADKMQVDKLHDIDDQAEDEQSKRRRTDEGERADLGDQSSAAAAYNYEAMNVGNVTFNIGNVTGKCSEIDELVVRWIEGGITDETMDEVMACWIDGSGEYAWDDVNNIALPEDLVKKARKEEMSHMKGNMFKVVKKSEASEGDE